MKSSPSNNTKKQRPEKNIFLRRIGPCESARRYFEDDKLYLEQLSTFVTEGLNNGDKVIVVATAKHLADLDNQLRAEGYDIFSLSVHEQFVPLDAEKLLDKFLVKWWPDAVLFRYLVATLASRVLKTQRDIRVYSEMAALLWLKGHPAASAQLEIIWNRMVETTTEYDFVTLKSEILPRQADNEQLPAASFLR
jgi:hypothetical protein